MLSLAGRRINKWLPVAYAPRFFWNLKQGVIATRKLGLALALLLASTAFANAGTISFIYSQDAGAPTTVNGATDSESITNVNTGNFMISFASGLTNPDLPAPDLLQADNISFTSTGSAGASHTLHLSVVANGLTSPTGLQALLSQFDVTGLTGGWTVTASTDINGATLSLAPTFSGPSTGVDILGSALLTSPFSVSAHWDITNGGLAGSSNVGIAVRAVPGPVLCAGLPGLLAAMGFGGWNWRRRRKTAAAA